MNVSFEELLTAGTETLGCPLPEKTVSLLRLYGEEILLWNPSVNLVSVRDLSGLAVRHFLDSLTVLPLLPEGPFSLLDLGTGAGLPGIPLKLARTDASLFLVDASRKKISFLRNVIRRLGLSGAQAEQGRVETWVPRNRPRGAFDRVVSRAAFPLPLFLARSARFAGEGGSIIAMKGKSFQDDLKSAAETLDALHLELVDRRDLVLPFTEEERHLLVFRKKNGQGGAKTLTF
jgi:16S rRNA (guanine527-N7)-methyltransferase